MTKKEIIKKIILPGIILITIAEIIFISITQVQYNEYKRITNNLISEIVNNVVKEYPELEEEKIVKMLTKQYEENNNDIDILQKYGYSLENDNYINALKTSMQKSQKINFAFILITGMIILIIVLRHNQKQNNKIEEIYRYLNELNNRNYLLKIKDNGEDELSKLRNQLYKTTVLLKETAEISETERKKLSNALADISHQIKTPLTSIRIMLDNIEENPQMDENIKADFIKEISKQIEWISSLIISLLKLAKFDAGSIIMNDEKISVKKLINDIISNLAIMIELKNINIEFTVNEDVFIKADYKWQKEALTNIIKNAIEHSKLDSSIKIEVEDNSIFVKIIIQDEGEGIDKEDISHIFERFYKTKKSSENSIGIGLSLAKTIIEKENGYITVESQKNKGTKFEIKYLK